MHTLILSRLGVSCCMGRTDDEPRIEQPIFVSVKVTYDAHRATKKDEPGQTICYNDLARVSEEFLRKTRFALIESAAEKLAKLLLQSFPAHYVRVTIDKPCAHKKAAYARAEYEVLRETSRS